MRLKNSTIKMAARQSDLARLQAHLVGEALTKQGITPAYFFRASLGDINLQDPLWKMPQKGVFTEDFVADLESGAVDCVVHSWKDLPTEKRVNTEIVATLPRADQRDLFLFNSDRFEQVRIRAEMSVLTSSPRRAHNLEAFFRSHLPFSINKVEFRNVRGNVPTRIRKWLSGEADALIVAKAAIDRLLQSEELSAHADEYAEVRASLREALAHARFMVLPLTLNPTAAAQGALAIEIRRDRDDLRELFLGINDSETETCVKQEREVLSSYGGGCHQKIGISVLQRSFGQLQFLRGLTDQGVILDSVRLHRPEGHLRRVAASEMWAADEANAGFFDREALSASHWSQKLTSAKHLWVSRESAWPHEYQQGSHQTVWCAGLKTWQKLAQKGVWVHGCAEGLGETEATRIETLLGFGSREAMNWLKLTHVQSAQKSKDSLATYRLRPRPVHEVPDIRGRQHYFWMSGTGFDRAVELFPEILNAQHSSGPGLTHEHLRRCLSEKNAKAPQVYLSVQAWRDELTKKS